MAHTLNIDFWDWVNPETQKVVKLRKGDEVPAEVLNQEGIDVEELSNGRAPMLLAKRSDEAKDVRASEGVGTSMSPPPARRAESK